MTPRAIRLRIERFWEREKQKQKQTEYYAWLTGYFNQYAIGASMSKKIKYPKNPLEETPVIDDSMELTEEEKDKYRMQFLKRLQRMEKRFNKNQGE